MSLNHILIIIAACLVGGRLLPSRWKYWFIFTGSIVGIFWLQPVSPIRNLSFWLPLSSICLVILTWAIIQTNATPLLTADIYSGITIVLIILVIGSLRYLPFICCLSAERPPQIANIFYAIMIIFGTALALKNLSSKSTLQWVLFITLVTIFIVIKFPWLSEKTAQVLRNANRQDVNLASSNDIMWLGFSYLSLRLLHVLRDHQSRKTANLKLSDLISYTLFLPAYIAGPIDRSQRFITELKSSIPIVSAQNIAWVNDFLEGGKRILMGFFSKFVLADILSLVALNPQNALEIKSTLWTWVALYGYTLRIYFDFSGYTDIAIGAGKWLGITLPENFDSPYRKTSLVAFWNSWHITLAQWFRAYFFNPLTRALRIKSNRLPLWGIILFGQISTMLLIGLWHGVTWNFAIWGLWHGCGLFINNRWSDLVKNHNQAITNKPYLKILLKFGGWLLTFNFVALGWIWFVFPDPSVGLKIIQHLLGIY